MQAVDIIIIAALATLAVGAGAGADALRRDDGGSPPGVETLVAVVAVVYPSDPEGI